MLHGISENNGVITKLPEERTIIDDVITKPLDRMNRPGNIVIHDNRLISKTEKLVSAIQPSGPIVYHPDQSHMMDLLGVSRAHSMGYHGRDENVVHIEHGLNINHRIFGGKEITVIGAKPETVENDAHANGVASMIIAFPSGAATMHGISREVHYACAPAVEGPESVAQQIDNSVKEMPVGTIIQIVLAVNNYTYYNGFQAAYPLETQKVVWEAARKAVDKGYVVIAAAGNGHNNLDADMFKDYRDWGDSGVILVGADNDFSTHGSRVDLWSYGRDVLVSPSDGMFIYEKGTSFTTPQITGVSALVQQRAREKLGYPLGGEKMREILKKSGGTKPTELMLGGLIGFMPDVIEAFLLIDRLQGNIADNLQMQQDIQKRGFV